MAAHQAAMGLSANQKKQTGLHRPQILLLDGQANGVPLPANRFNHHAPPRSFGKHSHITSPTSCFGRDRQLLCRRKAKKFGVWTYWHPCDLNRSRLSIKQVQRKILYVLHSYRLIFALLPINWLFIQLLSQCKRRSSSWNAYRNCSNCWPASPPRKMLA